MNIQRATNHTGRHFAAEPWERRHQSRGVVIIGVLFFILITSIMLMGIGTFAVSHQTRVKVDASYAMAIDLAEAGVDYEFRKISLSTANPDQYPGTAYNLGTGTYTVYCTNKDGTTPWTVGNYLSVVSTGTVDGVSRTVKDGKTAFTEYMQIVEEDGTLVYKVQLRLAGKLTAFKLKSLANNEVVLSNPEHDFPQRIIYRKLADGSLFARIEGTQNGKAAFEDYPMKPARCD